MTFGVISFYENNNDKEGSLYTVPSGWISADGKFVFYPRSSAIERRCVGDADSVPDIHKWKKSKCRIRKRQFQTYSEAIAYEELLSEMTDTESENKQANLENLCHQKFKHFKRPSKNNYDTLLENVNFSKQIDLDHELNVVESDYINHTEHQQPIQYESTELNVVQNIKADEVNKQSAVIQQVVVMDMEQINNLVKNVVKTCFTEFKKNEASTQIKLDNIITKIDVLIDKCASTNNNVAIIADTGFVFPLQNLEDVLKLEDALSSGNKHELVSKLTKYFVRYKQDSGHLTIKPVLDALVSAEVQSIHFSWSGRNVNKNAIQKLAFKTNASNVVEFIYSICLIAQPSFTVKEYQMRMVELLKTAKSRTFSEKLLNKEKKKNNCNDEKNPN